jgi:hypothetical protein
VPNEELDRLNSLLNIRMTKSENMIATACSEHERIKSSKKF